MSCPCRAPLALALSVGIYLLLAGCGGPRSDPDAKGSTDKPPATDQAPQEKPPDGGKPPQASKITKENYDKIKVGMTRREVEAILGRFPQKEPLPGAVNSEKVTWRDGKKFIQIVFEDGKVKFFEQYGL